MKVLFNIYQAAFQYMGGGEIQLMKTKEALEKLGVHVDLFNQWGTKLEDYDLFHNFAATESTHDICFLAKDSGLSLAVSPIFWPEKEVPNFEVKKEPLLNRFKKRASDYALSLSRRLYSRPSHFIDLLNMADILFPNSNAEADILMKKIGIDGKKIHVVPNGVDEHFKNADKQLFMETHSLDDFVLCVGRIENRKNQLNLIRALKDTEIPIVFIGKPDFPSSPYYKKCLSEATKDMHFLGYIAHDSPLLESAYAAANTLVLPSWYETPGLAALEAGLAGAKIVITNRGCTKEYFDKYATYVDPSSVPDITNKVLETYERPKDSKLRRLILKKYLWKHVAEKTMKGYNKLLR